MKIKSITSIPIADENGEAKAIANKQRSSSQSMSGAEKGGENKKRTGKRESINFHMGVLNLSGHWT